MELYNKPEWPGWETVRLIGRGSFGSVYEIQRQVFDDTEKAALKVISIPQVEGDIDEMYNDGYDDASISKTFHEHLKSIVAEYSLMRKMNGCPYVVNCDDLRYEQHEDGIGWDVFIRMELLTPLTKALPAEIPEELVIRIAKDLCHALMECEKLDIVHRDIKPQNIFVSERGEYKLGDFGIAKIVEKTMGGTKIGTYKYMAPEVYNNQPYGSASDIYSLGLVLYWLLNERRLPFLPLPPASVTASMEEDAKLRRFSGEMLPAPKNGSEMLKQIVLKACAFDPKTRFVTARDILRELERLEHETEAETEGTMGIVPRRLRTKPVQQTAAVQPQPKKPADPPKPPPVAKPTPPPVHTPVREAPPKKGLSVPILAAGILGLVLLLVIGIFIGRATVDTPPAVNIPGDTSVLSEPELPPEVPAPVGNHLRSDALELVSGYAYSWIAEAASKPVFGSEIMRSEIKSVHFCDSLANMSGDAWDVSDAGDGSVMAWVTENGGLYDLYIGAEGGVNGGNACADLFAGYTNLERIEFSNCFHTDGSVDMSRMFFGCRNLKQIDCLLFETSQVMDMSRMFFLCSSIDHLDLSRFDTSSVESMAYMFWRCEEISELDLRSFDTSSVRNMSGMFEWCTDMERLDVSGFDTSSVRNMSAMFSYCINLRSLDLGHFDTAQVEDMSKMFSFCDRLIEVDVSSFNTGNVVSASGMFHSCKELEKLDVSGFDMSHVVYMDQMFSWCITLNELDLSGFNTASAEDMYEMFYCCPCVTADQVTHFSTGKVTRSDRFMNGSDWLGLFK